ncbi:MAG TPA: hypothetical protein VLA90_05485 [Actinomycetota bacterium]|nr:hypothetical protein [Actinomycetota bacterium]
MSARDVRTVHLGQFTHEHAEAIAERLERSDIVWWYKAPGFFSQIWEHGVHLFVDRRRLDEARTIARAVLAEPHSEDPGPSSGQT